MDKKIKKNRIMIITMFLIGLFGIILLSYNYISSKIRLTFETVNLELHGNQQPKKVEKNSKEETKIIEETKQETKEETTIEKRQRSSYTKTYQDYFGYIEIPKINLTQGLVKLESKNNNVDKNIQTIYPSDYPDIENGNLILAAHSGSSSIAYFKHLYKLKENDIVNIYYNNSKYIYNISKIYTTPKNGRIPIYRDLNKTTVTLITCTKNDEKTQTVYIAELIRKEGV